MPKIGQSRELRPGNVGRCQIQGLWVFYLFSMRCTEEFNAVTKKLMKILILETQLGPAQEARAREVGQGGWQVWGVESGVGDRVTPGSTMQPPDEAAVFSLYDRAPWLMAPLARSLRGL